jgi:hypothetical protein
LLSSTNEQKFYRKHCYNDLIALGRLLEKFSTDRKVHRRMINGMDSNIIATQDLVNQDTRRSIRSLNINSEEHINVLKESVMPWINGVAAGRN